LYFGDTKNIVFRELSTLLD